MVNLPEKIDPSDYKDLIYIDRRGKNVYMYNPRRIYTSH